MIHKFATYSAMILVVVIVFGILFRGRFSSWLEGDEVLAAKVSQQEPKGKNMANMPGMDTAQGKQAEHGTTPPTREG